MTQKHNTYASPRHVSLINGGRRLMSIHNYFLLLDYNLIFNLVNSSVFIC